MKRLILLLLVLSIHTLYSQYTDYQSPFTGSLNSGDFAKYQFGTFGGSFQAWICGDSSMIMKIYPNFVPPQFRIVKGNIPQNISFKAMGAIDTNTALVAGLSGSNAVIYRTSNAGVNWVQVFIQNGGNINGIWFKSALNGFMAGNPVGGRWSLFRTTNAGMTWDSAGMYLPQAGSETGFVNDVFTRGDTVWMGTNNSRLYISSNFGITWGIRNTPGVQNIRCVNNDFSNNVGYAAGDSLLETYSWGNTWTIVHNIPGSGPITGMTASNPGVDASSWPLFYSKQNFLYYNITGWVLFHTASSGVYTYLFKARPTSQYWDNFSAMLGLMSNGKVWVCNCVWGAIEPIGNNIPDEFRLYQNYPNPFNPVTKIRFDLPAKYSSHFLELIIYDASGKLVKVLLSGTYSPGTYEIEFDGKQLASGLYFYELNAGKEVHVRKMVLMK